MNAEKREDALRKLYEFTQTRPRPEDVADYLLSVLDIRGYRRAVLETAAVHSFRRRYNAWSSMARDFARRRS